MYNLKGFTSQQTIGENKMGTVSTNKVNRRNPTMTWNTQK